MIKAIYCAVSIPTLASISPSTAFHGGTKNEEMREIA
jgi:hypothetical protein